MHAQQVPWWRRVLGIEPALLRGLLIAVSAILLQAFGRTVIEDDLITALIDTYTALSALVAAFLIRPSVTPNAKVIVYDDTPFRREVTLVSGPATVEALGAEDEEDLLYKARMAA